MWKPILAPLAAAASLALASVASAASLTPPNLVTASTLNNPDLLLVWPYAAGGPLEAMSWSTFKGQMASGLSGDFLAPANNLSDLGNATIARGNLGLGTASTAGTGTSGATLCLLNAASCTFSGKVLTPASTTSSAGLNLPPGTAPTSPTNGDLWTTSSGAFAQINGATVNLGGGCSSGCTFNGSNTFGNAATNVQTIEGDLLLTGSGTPTGTCSSISGIDAHGTATMPSASSCSISFAHTKGSAPYCFVNQTNGSSVSIGVTATSTTGFTITVLTGASAAMSFTWLCTR
jgi:hypothetical protein